MEIYNFNVIYLIFSFMITTFCALFKTCMPSLRIWRYFSVLPCRSFILFYFSHLRCVIYSKLQMGYKGQDLLFVIWVSAWPSTIYWKYPPFPSVWCFFIACSFIQILEIRIESIYQLGKNWHLNNIDFQIYEKNMFFHLFRSLNFFSQ